MARGQGVFIYAQGGKPLSPPPLSGVSRFFLEFLIHKGILRNLLVPHIINIAIVTIIIIIRHREVK